MATSLWRGHEIYFNDAHWVYADTGEPTAGNERACGCCGRHNTEEGHDGCLGTLPMVMNACCGHGVPEEAYVQLNPRTTLRGEKALQEILRLLRT